MVNCLATVTKKVDVLDHGHKAASAPTSTTLYDGPAYFSAPSRSWQREAALEGIIDGDLHVHTSAGLQAATTVVITGHHHAGTYEVRSGAATGNGWRLTVARRP